MLMISVIAENLDSLGALNRLMRTNKHLSVEASTTCTISKMVQNMNGMNRKALWKLFVLPGKIPPTHLVLNSNLYPLGLFSSKQPFSPADAFKSSLMISGGIPFMNRVSLEGKNQSNAMKLV